MASPRMADVAIVIPCRDQAEFLPDAIESALAQEGSASIEVHVVDDGSRDNTVEVANHYAARGVRCHRTHAGNQNLARLVGVARSSSAFVLFLDADNWLAPDYASRCLEALNSTAPHGSWLSGFAYGDRIEHVERDARPSAPKDRAAVRRVAQGAYDPRRLLTGNYIDMCALVRRSCVRLDPALAWYQDWDQWLTLRSEHVSGVYEPNACFHYRVHGRNRTSARLEIDDTELLKLCRKHGPVGPVVQRKVSVVVVARTQPEIDDTVARLRDQDYPEIEFCTSTRPALADAFQEAASRATGQVVVFTETDVTPLSTRWLRELVAEVKPGEVVHGLTVTDTTPNMANTACETEVARRFPRNPRYDRAEDTEWLLRMQAAGIRYRQASVAPVMHVRPFVGRRQLERAYTFGREWVRLMREYGYAQPAEVVERSRVEVDIHRRILQGLRDEWRDGGPVPDMPAPRARAFAERARRACRAFIEEWRGW